MARFGKLRSWYSECFISAAPVLTPVSGGIAMMVSPKQLLSAALGLGTLVEAQGDDVMSAAPQKPAIFRRKDCPEEIYVYSSDDMIDLVIRNYGGASLTEDMDPKIIDFLGSVFEAVMSDPYSYIDRPLIGGDELCVVER